MPGPWNRVGGIKGVHTHIMYVDMGGLTCQPPFLGTILTFSAVICLCSMFGGGHLSPLILLLLLLSSTPAGKGE